MITLILTLVVALVGAYIYTNAAGYLVHKVLHIPVVGPAYQAHRDHHECQYPPEDYLSKKYRPAKLGNQPIWYYLPPAILSAIVILWFFPLYLAVPVVITIGFVAWLNDWLHTAFHIDGHWLERFKWFQRSRDLHWYHHVDAEKNIGILSWFSDHIMGTYKIPDNLPHYRKSDVPYAVRPTQKVPPAVEVPVEMVLAVRTEEVQPPVL